jgi:hypothetical protein
MMPLSPRRPAPGRWGLAWPAACVTCRWGALSAPIPPARSSPLSRVSLGASRGVQELAASVERPKARCAPIAGRSRRAPATIAASDRRACRGAPRCWETTRRRVCCEVESGECQPQSHAAPTQRIPRTA